MSDFAASVREEAEVAATALETVAKLLHEEGSIIVPGNCELIAKRLRVALANEAEE